MNVKSLAITAALMCIAVPPIANAAVVYSSVSNLFATPTQIGFCSSCNGSNEPLDQFTLSTSVSITGLNLVTESDLAGKFEGLGGFVFDVFDSTHTTLLFSRTVSAVSVIAPTSASTAEITGSILALNLSAGTYWAGFQATNLAVADLPGGNNSLIETGTPHLGVDSSFIGGNTGYQLLGSVEAASRSHRRGQ